MGALGLGQTFSPSKGSTDAPFLSTAPVFSMSSAAMDDQKEHLRNISEELILECQDLYKHTYSNISCSSFEGAPDSQDSSTMDDIQQEMRSMSDELTIECRDLYKHYGSGKSRLNVLRGLNMTVPKGAM